MQSLTYEIFLFLKTLKIIVSLLTINKGKFIKYRS